jgi:hypothetical protein
MQQSSFFAARLSSEDIKQVSAVLRGPSRAFSERVIELGLNPALDFRFADLAACDFSHCDLRHFDLTGADLRCCVGLDVVWDNSTILDGAILGDSFFATQVKTDEETAAFSDWEQAYTQIAQENEADGFEKLIALFRGNDDESKAKAFYLVKRLFFSTNNAVIRNNMLYCVGTYANTSVQTKEFLNYLIARHSKEPRIMRSAIRVVSDLYYNDQFARDIFLLCLRSNDENVRQSALRGLIKGKAFKEEIPKICHCMRFEKSVLLRKSFLTSLGKTLGIAHFLNDGKGIIDYSERVTMEKQRDIARTASIYLWFKEEPRSGSSYRVNQMDVERLQAYVPLVLDQLKRFGLPIDREEA